MTPIIEKTISETDKFLKTAFTYRDLMLFIARKEEVLLSPNVFRQLLEADEIDPITTAMNSLKWKFEKYRYLGNCIITTSGINFYNVYCYYLAKHKGHYITA